MRESSGEDMTPGDDIEAMRDVMQAQLVTSGITTYDEPKGAVGGPDRDGKV